MKKLISVLLLLSLAAGAIAPAARAEDIPESSLGYIVQLREDAAVSLMDGDASGGHGLVRAESAEELSRLLASGQVEYYEENAVVRLMARPNDSYYGYQWNLTDIGAEAAWDAGLTGEGAVVAVIDSGVFAEHEDLHGVSLTSGIDLVDGSANVGDTLGHGTIVTGIIAATRDNGVGVAGIADKVTIVPLKCFEREDETDIKAVCDGVYAAVDSYGCDVICLSLGTESDTRALREAVEYAASKNVIIVAAVGNEGGSRYFYPAAYDCVVGVGSYDRSGRASSFSQINDSVFVSAPGDQIYSTYIGRRNDYAYSSGTSFSTPHVAAMAALAKSVDKGMTVAEFKNLLVSTSTDAGTAGYDTSFGHGKINLQGFTQSLLAGDYELPAFTDTVSHWAESSIAYAVRKGYFDGLSDTVFAPDGGMTRAMLVTVLWRRAGEPEPDMSLVTHFSDVTNAEEWYYKAVYWAASNGIVEGDSGRFSPNAGITREQIATILWRYSGSQEGGAASIAGYLDVADVSGYAMSAMSWCCAAGLIQGDNGALNPKGEATRAQVATLMERYDAFIV